MRLTGMHGDRFSNVHALSSRRQRGLSISSSPIVHGPSVTPCPFVKPAPLTDSKGAGHCAPSPISSPPAGEPTCCCCWPDCMSTKGVASFSCKFWMTDKQGTSLRVGKRPADGQAAGGIIHAGIVQEGVGEPRHCHTRVATPAGLHGDSWRGGHGAAVASSCAPRRGLHVGSWEACGKASATWAIALTDIYQLQNERYDMRNSMHTAK